MKKGIFYNTASQLAAKFISMSVTVAATILITRTFGKEGYGQFSLMQTLPALFYILADFGLNTTAIKSLGKNGKDTQNYYQTVLTLRLIMSAVFVAILNIIVIFLPYSPFLKTGIALSSLLIITQAVFSSTNLIFQYKQRYDLSSVGYIAGSIFTLFLVIAFIKMNLDVRFISFSYVLGGLLAFILASLILKRQGFKSVIKIDPVFAKSLIISSLPLGLMFVFSQINFKADSILLSVLELPQKFGLNNIQSVAVYALPYKVFEVALVLPTFFMNSTYPLFVSKLNQSPQDFLKVFNKTLKYMAGLGIVTSVCLFFASPVVISILGGEQFDQSIKVLRILSAGLFFFFLSQPVSYLIVTIDKQKHLPLIYLIGAIINVSANVLLIPIFGFYASAYLTWGCEILILALLTYFAVKSWKKYTHVYTKNI